MPTPLAIRSALAGDTDRLNGARLLFGRRDRVGGGQDGAMAQFDGR